MARTKIALMEIALDFKKGRGDENKKENERKTTSI